VLPVISKELLTRLMENRPVTRVAVSVQDSEFRYAFD
jgi:hypothetical protein